MTLTTTHKGYEISYREWDEKWSCAEIGKSNTSLAALRKQIDSHDRRMRKGATVDALQLSTILPNTKLDQSADAVSMKPMKVVEYLGAGRGFRGQTGPIEVAVMPDGRSRRTMRLSDLYKVTPENEEILRRAQRKGSEAIAAISQMHLILDELERLSASDVADLAALAERVNPDD